MNTSTLETVPQTMTPHDAAEQLVPIFKQMAASLWPKNRRDVQQDLVQEMSLACLTVSEPAEEKIYLHRAFWAACNYLDKERRNERTRSMPDDRLRILSDFLGNAANAPEIDLDPKPDPIPLPTHPVFRILSQAV